MGPEIGTCIGIDASVVWMSSSGLITKIVSCAQSKNEQEKDASNLNITRGGVLNHKGQHVFVRVLG
jgi:hypothetical protein